MIDLQRNRMRNGCNSFINTEFEMEKSIQIRIIYFVTNSKNKWHWTG